MNQLEKSKEALDNIKTRVLGPYQIENGDRMDALVAAKIGIHLFSLVKNLAGLVKSAADLKERDFCPWCAKEWGEERKHKPDCHAMAILKEIDR